jgi:hypothetical protein
VEGDVTLYVEVVALYANGTAYYSAKLVEHQVSTLRRELESLTAQEPIPGGAT